MKLSAGVLSAVCETSKRLPDANMASSVSLSCDVRTLADAAGGFAVLHTGTPEESAIYIVSMTMSWIFGERQTAGEG